MLGECHCHIALNGADYAAASSCHGLVADESVIRAHLKEYQSRKISFVRDGGDGWGVSKLARKLAPEYGIDYRSPIFAIHKNGHYGGIVGCGFDTLKEYRALVARAHSEGADFIKIMTTGIMSFKEYGRIIAGEPLDHCNLVEMVHIAHEEGFAVMSHTNGRDAVMSALEAGVDSIEHGNFIDADCISAFTQSQTAFVPTATVARNLYHSGTERNDAEVQIVLNKIWESSRHAIKQAYDAGVILALGSDAGAVGVLHGQGTLDEYQCFKDSVIDESSLNDRLQAGEEFIKTTFRRR